MLSGLVLPEELGGDRLLAEIEFTDTPLDALL
jgi:phage protein U